MNLCPFSAKIEIDGEAQFKNILATELDGWPILSSSFDPNAKSAIQKLIDYRKRSVRPFVNVYVTSNPANPAQYVIAVDQPSWFFSKKYYNDTLVVSAYKQYITQVAEFMGADKANSAYKTEIDEMYQLETEFVKV